MGRWMSPDWADKPEPIPYADLNDAQSLIPQTETNPEEMTRKCAPPGQGLLIQLLTRHGPRDPFCLCVFRL